MAYLHSEREQFRDAIDLAYDQTGVMVQAIEKDYYVTMLLRLLAQKIQLLFFSALFDGVAQRTILFAQSKGILENLDIFLPSHNSNLFSLGNLILKDCTTFYRSCRCFLIIVPLFRQRCRRVMPSSFSRTETRRRCWFFRLL